MEDISIAENIEGFKWTKSVTLLLVALIKENFARLQEETKKASYQRIAKQINAKFGTNLNCYQIESKWKGMRRTYVKIKKSNANLRQARKCWEYYDIIDEILSGAPKINCQSAMSTEDTSEACDDMKFNYIDCNEIATTSPMPKKCRKRRYSSSIDVEEAKERRHQEKMQLARRFLDLFQEMVDKM